MSKKNLRQPQQTTGRYVRPATGATKSTAQEHPAFCLRYLDNNKYGLGALDNDQRLQFLDVMRRLSQLTWAQISSTPHHGLGAEPIPRYRMNVPLPSCVTEDTVILAFRCFGKCPMVGFRDEAVFHVLFLDPKHETYGD